MAALRFRYAPPTATHGAGGNNALTIKLDHSVGADHGFVPGLALSWWLFGVSAEATFLPMLLRPDMAASVFALIFAMCAASGAVAVRKLRDANPADMF